jgi:hypothetical protein
MRRILVFGDVSGQPIVPIFLGSLILENETKKLSRNVAEYQYMPRNIPEGTRSHFRHGGSWKERRYYLAPSLQINSCTKLSLIRWPRTLNQFCSQFFISLDINLYEPCVLYIGRAYRFPPDVAFYVFFSTNINTEYFNHAAHSPLFSSKCCLFHNATFLGSCIIHILHTGCAKI